MHKVLYRTEMYLLEVFGMYELQVQRTGEAVPTSRMVAGPYTPGHVQVRLVLCTKGRMQTMVPKMLPEGNLHQYESLLWKVQRNRKMWGETTTRETDLWVGMRAKRRMLLEMQLLLSQWNL